MIKKIVSGGQTGVDRMGLEVAKKLNIPTGGFAPLGWRTENGADLTLEEFGLVQCASSNYDLRTDLNIRNSDGTVVFGNTTSPGTRFTIRMCNANNKRVVVNPTVQILKDWIKRNNIEVLNVAGNRASKLSAKQLKEYEIILTESLS